MISLFDLDDDDMLTCKFGNWWETNPQRGRSNNSAVIVRHKIEKEVFLELWKKIEMSGSGEPGFFFTNDANWGLNPCAEISLRPFQFCNLTTINAGDIKDQDDFNARAKAAAFIGTLQASYTNFHYLRDIWKRTTEKEALIGVSMTGIASGTVLNLDMKEAANVVKEENARVAEMIGTNKAARTTTVKPEGTSSLVLGTSSGIHAWHNDFYIRRIRVGKNEGIYQYLADNHPEIVEDEFFKPKQQAVISVPQKAPKGAITRQESALDLLGRTSKVWKEWVKAGHRKGENKNNVSVTVTIKPDEWVGVGEWMWDNRENFTALSVLPYSDHSYMQAPFEDITEEQYKEMVGHLHKIDLTKVVEVEDNTDLAGEVACGGGGCEVQ
jgi:ribonucleoside-triphosphate reductase